MFSKFATINFLLVLAFVFFIEVKSNRLSWCDPELCPNRKHHIACEHDGVSEYEKMLLVLRKCLQNF